METTRRRFTLQPKALQKGRLNGEGPTLIEAKTYRHGGHHVNDPGLYMDQEALAEWKSKDPIDILRKKDQGQKEAESN